jgi:hypothetical protein
MGKALAADLERRRAALHRRSAALRAPTNPADEPAFIKEFDSIERETAESTRYMKQPDTVMVNPGVVLVCTHELAGKTVPMAELPPDMTD